MINFAICHFLLNLHNSSVAEVVEIRLLGYVFSDKFVCVLNCAFLPGAVRIGEIDDDPVTPPDAEPARYLKMRGKLNPLSVVIVRTVSRYGNSSLATAIAVGIAFLPSLSFSMRMKFVERSVSVRMACPKESTMVSISQSPNLLPSASTGRS